MKEKRRFLMLATILAVMITSYIVLAVITDYTKTRLIQRKEDEVKAYYTALYFDGTGEGSAIALDNNVGYVTFDLMNFIDENVTERDIVYEIATRDHFYTDKAEEIPDNNKEEGDLEKYPSIHVLDVWGQPKEVGRDSWKYLFEVSSCNGEIYDGAPIVGSKEDVTDYMFKYAEPDYPTGMETHECHSMSMEFLCHKYMDDFFGEKSDKYRYKHIVDAISFIPYGTIVDEFQHLVYENPDLTPDERKSEYLKLEKKYRPYLSFEGIPYLELGTRWQYQMHIFESPFYYIDYCIAQCVALGFLRLSRENFDAALEKYVDFLKKTGGVSLTELIEAAGLESPFRNDALKKTSESAVEIITAIEKDLM